MVTNMFKYIAPVVAAALVATSTSGLADDPQGVTGTEVVIGSHQDLSGPITFWGVPVKNGMMMAAEEINAAGGVHGRTLKLLIEDSGYDPKKAVLATQKLLTRDEIFVMAGAMGTPTVLASMPLVLKKGLPHIFPLTAAEQTYEPFNPLTFAMFTPYYHSMRAGTKYMIETFDKKRPCAMHQDDEFGLNNLRGVEQQLDEMGMELVSVTSYKRGATDFSSQIARMRGDDCDVVFLATIIRETVGAMAEARKLGWNVDFLTGQAGFAPEVALLGKDVVEGLYGVGQTPIPYRDTADEAVGTWMDRYKDMFGSEANIQAVAGYNVVMLTAEGLQNAGPALTVEAFVAGLEQINGYEDIFGSAPVTFSSDNHLGNTRVFVSQIRDGRWERLTEPLLF